MTQIVDDLRRNHAAMNRDVSVYSEAADEIERLTKVVQLLYAGTLQGHNEHWDPEQTHGANCPACKFARDQREAAVKILGYVPESMLAMPEADVEVGE